MTEKTQLLVDGSSYLYRAFHALPDLRNKAGEPTGAIYGIIAMLRRLRTDPKLNRGATLGAVVFDAPGKTFRDDWYEQYKANRSSTPPDLVAQIPRIHGIVRAMGWPLIMIAGIEADDVIGTLAVQASARGVRSVISTGDKDLAQLVNEQVTLVNTMARDGVPLEWLDPSGVQAKFGVPPERIVDYLSLVGDTVDNVPGVEKVGPKTAVKWLQQYGSLDEIVMQAASIGGAVGENLRRALDWLPTARKLVTVKLDCALPDGFVGGEPALEFKPEDDHLLMQLFGEAGFRSWTRELEERLGVASATVAVSTPGPASLDQAAAFGSAGAGNFSDASGGFAAGAMANGGFDARGTGGEATTRLPAIEILKEYECVGDEPRLDAWLEKVTAAELTSFDTETTSLDQMQAELVGISLSTEPGKACYIPVAHNYAGAPHQLSREYVLARLKPWLESEQHLKVGQHLKYDTHVLENYGIRLRGVAHDTLLQSYVLEAHRSHDMDSLAARHLNRQTIKFEQVAGKGANQITFDQVAVDTACEYAAEDAEVTMHLHQTLYPHIASDSKLEYIYREIEVPTARVLQRMERNGVLIDSQLLAIQSDELGRKMMDLERDAHALAGHPFNMNSPKQLGEILFEKLQLPVVKKTASGAPSTDEEVLAKLAEDYPLPKLLLEYRSIAKLKGTYTDKLPRMVNPRTGRVHTSYSQAVAVTGRLASTDPNLQNIPIRTAEGRRVREAFIAPAGHRLVSADYSQIELRIMAHISEDAGLLHAFAEGLDVHCATASEVFGVPLAEVSSEQRRYAKVINFGLIYGMSAFGLAANLGIERSEAKNYIERYFARYPGVARYMEETRKLAKLQGYVETVFGRRLWLAEINSPNGPRRQGAERAAINAPMQGTAADLIKLAMIAVQRWLDGSTLKTQMLMQVHDELILEVPDAELDIVKTELNRLMIGVAQLKVPLEVGIGSGLNWDQAH